MTENISVYFNCEPFVEILIHTCYVSVFACFLLSFLVLFAAEYSLFTKHFSSSLDPSGSASMQYQATSEFATFSSSLHFLFCFNMLFGYAYCADLFCFLFHLSPFCYSFFLILF